MQQHYQCYRFLDAPKRYVTLMLDEFIVVMTSGFFLLMTSHKFTWLIIGFLCFLTLRLFKQGQGPQILLLKAYWYLPAWVTKPFLNYAPAAHLRVWVG